MCAGAVAMGHTSSTTSASPRVQRRWHRRGYRRSAGGAWSRSCAAATRSSPGPSHSGASARRSPTPRGATATCARTKLEGTAKSVCGATTGSSCTTKPATIAAIMSGLLALWHTPPAHVSGRQCTSFYPSPIRPPTALRRCRHANACTNPYISAGLCSLSGSKMAENAGNRSRAPTARTKAAKPAAAPVRWMPPAERAASERRGWRACSAAVASCFISATAFGDAHPPSHRPQTVYAAYSISESRIATVV